jgi:hypothetical protein
MITSVGRKLKNKKHEFEIHQWEKRRMATVWGIQPARRLNLKQTRYTPSYVESCQLGSKPIQWQSVPLFK